MGIAPLDSGVMETLVRAATLELIARTLVFATTPQGHALNARVAGMVDSLVRPAQRVMVLACQGTPALLAQPLPRTPCAVQARGVHLVQTPVRLVARGSFLLRLPPRQPPSVSNALLAPGAPSPRRPFVHPVAWGSFPRR